MAWIKKPREILPQIGSSDYGSKRDVILRKGRIIVFKTRGHTAWSGVGATSYYSPQWILCSEVRTGSWGNDIYLNDGWGKAGESRMTPELWLSVLPKIAELMGLELDQMPRTIPRGCTLVWR